MLKKLLQCEPCFSDDTAQGASFEFVRDYRWTSHAGYSDQAMAAFTSSLLFHAAGANKRSHNLNLIDLAWSRGTSRSGSADRLRLGRSLGALQAFQQDPLVVPRHDFDELRQHLDPVIEDAPGVGAAGAVAVLL